LERDWQWRRAPTVGNANWIWRRRNGDLPSRRNPLLESFAILFHLNADAVGQLICAITFRGCEIHPLLRVRQDAIDHQLPVGAAGAIGTSRPRMLTTTAGLFGESLSETGFPS